MNEDVIFMRNIAQRKQEAREILQKQFFVYQLKLKWYRSNLDYNKIVNCKSPGTPLRKGTEKNSKRNDTWIKNGTLENI